MFVKKWQKIEYIIIMLKEHRDRSVFHGATELGITDLRIYGDTGLWKHGMYGMTEIRNYGV